MAVDAGARRRCLLIDSRLRPPSMAGGAAANELTFCRRDRCRRAAIAVVAAVSARHLHIRCFFFEAEPRSLSRAKLQPAIRT